MIEPNDTGNPCVINADFGKDLESFDEQKLLTTFSSFAKNDWTGSTWPPNVVHRKIWTLTGGYSVVFSPGMSSDPDFAMKLWKMGIRHFKGIAESRVYHFQARSTQRIKKNNGESSFYKNGGLPSLHFIGIIFEWERNGGENKRNPS